MPDIHRRSRNIQKLRDKVAPVILEDYFVIKYYKDDMTCDEIGKELGISGTSVRR